MIFVVYNRALMNKQPKTISWFPAACKVQKRIALVEANRVCQISEIRMSPVGGGGKSSFIGA